MPTLHDLVARLQLLVRGKAFPAASPRPATRARGRRLGARAAHWLVGGALLALGSRACLAGVLSAGEDWVAGIGQHLETIYQQGQPDLFLTGYTWHDPHTYTAAKLATLNSHAWGFGGGTHLVDSNGNDEMVYAMVFSDSHRNAQPVVGYAKQWDWRPEGGALTLGAGYTAGLTSRADIFHNIPFPIVLPLVSIGIGRVRFYGTFLPRVSSNLNNGNVAFFFARIAFR